METSFAEPIIDTREHPSELELVYNLLWDKCEETKAAYQRIAELTAELVECRDYFDNRADISNEHDEDGSPRPNEEMRRLVSIDECLHGPGF